MNIKVTSDIGGAVRKTAALRTIPAAKRAILQSWADRAIKRAKMGLRGEYLNARTSNLFRSVGKTIVRDGEVSHAIVGTNVIGKKYDVPYAKIQDEGGWVVPRLKKWLTIPQKGTKGRAANYPNLDFVPIKGSVTPLALLIERRAKKDLVRFVLVKAVKIPASYWWSKPWSESVGDLETVFDKVNLLAVAAKMAAGMGAKEAKK